MLARAGHSVVIVDFDPKMLAMARTELARESAEVRARVELVLGDGESAPELVGTDFDLACCHSVLMYQLDPAPMVSSLAELVRPGGLISVLCLNREAAAMRSGLQGRWLEAAASLTAGTQISNQSFPTRAHTRAEVTGLLEKEGAPVKDWQGIGIFTDHLEKIVADDPEQVYLVEWLAGSRDPYRQVARCFHLLAERRGQVVASHDRGTELSR
jgi:SAM-dependent methyltransferase